LSFDDPEPVYTFDEPDLDDSPSTAEQTASAPRLCIQSCGRPQKISDSVVKLPIRLKLGDGAEYPITVTITIDDEPGK
jgi:hypothetical protein